MTPLARCCVLAAAVCSACSPNVWPTSMVPARFNIRHESKLRICNACHVDMRSFKVALENGDVATALAVGHAMLSLVWLADEHRNARDVLRCSSRGLRCGILSVVFSAFHRCVRSAHVQAAANGRIRWVDHPLSVFPGNCFPIHLAASSGSLILVRWLVERMGVNVDVLDGVRATPVLRASTARHLEVVRYLVQIAHADVSSVRNVPLLQEMLQTALLHMPLPFPPAPPAAQVWRR